jgi:hypothetical protein
MEHKCKFHIWLLLQHKVVKAGNFLEGQTVDFACNLCMIRDESGLNLTLECPFFRDVCVS